MCSRNSVVRRTFVILSLFRLASLMCDVPEKTVKTKYAHGCFISSGQFYMGQRPAGGMIGHYEMLFTFPKNVLLLIVLNTISLNISTQGNCHIILFST